MARFLLLLLAFLLSSCSLIDKHINQHKKMASHVDGYVYDMDLEQLKKHTIEYFSDFNAAGPTNTQNNWGGEFGKGFVYKGKYFQKYEPGFFETISALTTRDKKYLSRFFTEGNYFRLDETKDEFKLLYDGVLYHGKRVGSNKSTIDANSIYKVERGPIKLDIDFMALMTKYGFPFSLKSGTILMDKSIKYQKPYERAEINLFKKLKPAEYEKVKNSL